MSSRKQKPQSLFPYRPNLRYLALFIPTFISVPVLTSAIYYSILPSWSNSEQNFQNIKQVLVRYGNLSSIESNSFSNNTISNSSNSYTKEAVRLAQLELSGWNLVSKLILPLVVVLTIFIIFTLRFWIPGVTRHSIKEKQDEDEELLKKPSEKALDFLNDYNKATITVAGFIVSILGGFLISSGLNNFYFFLGFETIIFSLIASLLVYPGFISSVKAQDKIEIDIPRFKGYFKVSCFAGWYLILGLILLITSFS